MSGYRAWSYGFVSGAACGRADRLPQGTGDDACDQQSDSGRKVEHAERSATDFFSGRIRDESRQQPL
jgi:hypothetical protein